MLPDFRCEFDSADRHGRCLESLEAQHLSPFGFGYFAQTVWKAVIGQQ
jgi:hypothetical protein